MTSTSGQDWQGVVAPLLLSLRVAIIATLFAIVLGLPAAWRLGVGAPFRGRTLIETLLFLPLVLPPTVIGYALLLILGRQTSVGRFLQDALHVRLLLTWQGATLASFLMAAPLFVRTASAAFASVDFHLLEAARTLGASEARVFWNVALPLAYRGVLAGGTLALARALGEFGATLMVAGNIVGETQTLPLALYDAAMAGDDKRAILFACLLFVVSFTLLAGVGAYGGRVARLRGEQN